MNLCSNPVVFFVLSSMILRKYRKVCVVVRYWFTDIVVSEMFVQLPWRERCGLLKLSMKKC